MSEATTPTIAVSDVTTRFNRGASERFHLPASNKWVGGIIRTKLGIPTAKSHGVYGINQIERERIRDLADRLGVPHDLTQELPSNDETAAAADSHSSTAIG